MTGPCWRKGVYPKLREESSISAVAKRPVSKPCGAGKNTEMGTRTRFPCQHPRVLEAARQGFCDLIQGAPSHWKGMSAKFFNKTFSKLWHKTYSSCSRLAVPKLQRAVVSKNTLAPIADFADVYEYAPKNALLLPSIITETRLSPRALSESHAWRREHVMLPLSICITGDQKAPH